MWKNLNVYAQIMDENNAKKSLDATHNAPAANKAFSRKLVCINYPGIVNNVDKMLQTLGGMGDIEGSVGSNRRNMELRFRPNDKFSKSLQSDTDKKPGILIKVVAKESTSQNAEASSGSAEPDIRYEVVGLTALTYSFNKLCDFQYLPLVTKEECETSDTPLSYIYNKIIPDALPDMNWLASEESKEMPLYLPPAIFSRFDNPKNSLYFDRSRFYETRFKPEYAQMLRQQELERKGHRTLYQKVIAKKSGHGAIFNTFNDPVVPSSPPHLALQFLNLRHTSKGAYEDIKELFEKRPIWSRSAILCISKVPKEQLKFILPAVAYHCHNGPWRVMWIKYGYDPKKDPAARIYQTFDFRARASAGLKLKIHLKRHYKNQPRIGLNIPQVSLTDVCEKNEDKNQVNESSYILKPGIIPPARQMFYQYCDVHVPEIQSMLSRLPPVMPGTVCDFRNGWLPNKFTDQCREIVNNYIIEQVQKELLEDNKKQTDSNSLTQPKSSNSTEQNDELSEAITQELLEISDTDPDDSDYIVSEDNVESSDEEEHLEIKELDENDDDEIDLEAAEDVNKILGENYEAMREFDKLIYESDSD